MNSQLDQQSVSSESISEQDHHGQENVTVQPEATQGGSVQGSRLCKTVHSRLLSASCNCNLCFAKEGVLSWTMDMPSHWLQVLYTVIVYGLYLSPLLSHSWNSSYVH